MTSTTSTTLPTPAPQINVETKTFWDATAEGKLLLPRCNECDVVIWYPK
ncbi:MAG: nucleotide-binding protein, partial [Mycobacterium sp.]|nr:nucleotide-binding protein [Mycobacterium sp.]